MKKLIIPSYNALLSTNTQIRAIQELYESVSDLDNTAELVTVDSDALFANEIPTEQKKQAALMQVLMLEQMYGYTSTTSTDPEYESVILGSEDRIIAGKKVNGKIELFGVEYD